MSSDVRGESPRHPDGELLDAYADGERTPGSVDRHVQTCPECQRTVRALREVRTELGRLAPITMPPEVARRIEAALSAAPLPPPATRAARRRRAGGSRADRRRPPAYAARSLRPDSRPPVRSGRPERIALLAVCLLFVVAGVGLFALVQHHGAASEMSTSSAAGAAAAPLEAAASPALVPSAADAVGGGAKLATGAASSTVDVAVSKAELTPSGVAQHAREMLDGQVPVVGHVSLGADGGQSDAARPNAATAPPATGQAPGVAWSAVVTPGLLGCYEALADTVHGVVLMVDQVVYRGRQAALVIVDVPEALPAPGEQESAAADHVDLTVVGLGCEPAQLTADTWFAATTTRV